MTLPVVGYVLRMFPQASETFIVNEILELERLGVQIKVYSYRRPRAPVRHECVRQIRAEVSYLPDPLYRHPLQLLEASRAVRRLQPVRYRQTAKYVLAHCLRERSVDTWRRFLQAAYLALQVEQSDVQHLHAHFAHGATRVAMLASMLTGTPFSFTAHARDIFSRDVDFRLLREKVQQARFVVTVSQYNRDFLTEKLGPALSDRLYTLYNGVDLYKFSPDAAVQREDGYILAVGRLVEKKGFLHLVEACGALVDRGDKFRCEIVGDGELRGRLERQIRRWRLNNFVKIVGARSQEELPDYYRRAAVLVMPAVRGHDGNQDGLPTVLLEGIACGAPVVASRITGIPEIVEHEENGLLVQPANPVELAQAVGRLLTDPGLRERFGAAARAKAEASFDLHTNVGELFRLLREHATSGGPIPAR